MLTEREQQIMADYNSGKLMSEISRDQGIGERQLFKLIKDIPGYVKRPRLLYAEKLPLSKAHQSIGRRLRDYYFSRSLDRRLAANQLGWSVLLLRNVELGQFNLTLFELQDISTFTKLTIEDLMNGGS